LTYSIKQCRFRGPIARQPALPWSMSLTPHPTQYRSFRRDYGNATLAGIPSHLTKRMQSVLNSAARFVFSASRYDRITPFEDPSFQSFFPWVSCSTCAVTSSLWTWPLTVWSWSHVTWYHLGSQCLHQFELDMTYCSTVRTTTNFHWLPIICFWE